MTFVQCRTGAADLKCVVLGRPAEALAGCPGAMQTGDHTIADHRPLELAEYPNMPNSIRPAGVLVSRA
jgi:hypothetical protein